MTERGSAHGATPSISGRRCSARPRVVGRTGHYFKPSYQVIGSARLVGTATSRGASSATIPIALPSNSSPVIGGAPAATTSTLPAGLCATPGRAESPSHDDGCVVVFWGGARRDLGRHGIAAFRQASVSFGIVPLAMAITTSAVKPSIGASCYKWPFLLLLLSFLSTI